jgi:hypothetical protein
MTELFHGTGIRPQWIVGKDDKVSYLKMNQSVDGGFVLSPDEVHEGGKLCASRNLAIKLCKSGEICVQMSDDVCAFRFSESAVSEWGEPVEGSASSSLEGEGSGETSGELAEDNPGPTATPTASSSESAVEVSSTLLPWEKGDGNKMAREGAKVIISLRPAYIHSPLFPPAACPVSITPVTAARFLESCMRKEGASLGGVYPNSNDGFAYNVSVYFQHMNLRSVVLQLEEVRRRGGGQI